MMNMNDNLLLIFAKPPVKGKAKTRLAKTIGHSDALAVYRNLLLHTRQVTDKLKHCSKAVYFAEEAENREQLWPWADYSHHLQQGQDLGERMHQAMLKSFKAGYKSVVIIGTDCPELSVTHVQEAFRELEEAPVVIGPATDGGYYLIGCSEPVSEIFYGKSWSSEKLLDETLQTLSSLGKKAKLLPPLSDIDEASDLERFPAFKADPLA